MLYMNDIPTRDEPVVATFPDDTAIIAEGNSIEVSIEKLQSTTDKVSSLTTRWRIKINEGKLHCILILPVG